MRWQVRGSREVYKSPWIKLRIDDVELPSGRRIDHHVIDFPKPSAGAVVIDQLGRILLLWRHRHITNASGWEFPAGWVEPGEDLREAVSREVLEETGYVPGHLEHLVTYHPLSGISTMTYTVFLATDAVRSGEPEIDETERIEWFTAEETRKLLRDGQIVDGPSLNAISFYLATYHG
jgi:8-oxo-dGTP pyrophosphatase MutT (NUDIX family)